MSRSVVEGRRFVLAPLCVTMTEMMVETTVNNQPTLICSSFKTYNNAKMHEQISEIRPSAKHAIL